ncbi:metal ABC transporter substrate-binding protein [Georgenia sp. SUBG003]|uniref:metal ABC transporter substrate-binding protein n=1 Tax=Georgenia sp. SUBG003 TaxID=1497974 RepID=UPI0004D58275|nr:ABC transporter substrate-binding protein [Georgenia sp. SUBG003]
MSARPPRTVAVAVALAGALVLAGCAASASDDGEDGRVAVLASFYPLQFVAEEVGGEDVSVSSMTPPGGDAHTLELAPAEVRAIGRADLVVYQSGFQPTVDEAVSVTAPEHVVDLADLATTPGDPHFWLDPTLLGKAAGEVVDALSRVDPDNAAGYADRAEDLTAALQELDARYREGLSGCTGATLVTAHQAFGYLADRYGLHQVGIAGIDPEVEPSPARLRDVGETVTAEGVRTLFFETSTSPKVTQTLAEDLGVGTAVLDPLEALTDPDADYLTVMRANLDALEAGLSCS